MPPDEAVLKDLVQQWLLRADEDLAAILETTPA
jgi:hypothetical protein